MTDHGFRSSDRAKPTDLLKGVAKAFERGQDVIPQRFPSLDGLRAVSIMLVIGAHAARTAEFPPWFVPYSGYLFNGSLGVLVFFVISGFLITWLLLKEQTATGRIDLIAFYKRRVLRIFPAFYAFLLTVLLMTLWVHRDFSMAEWISAATFTRNYYPGHWTLGHLWSISVEEQFYLLWPFALMLLKTKRRLLIAAVVVIATAPCLRLALHVSPWRWIGDYAFFTHADSLMFGCLLAITLHGGMAEMVRETVHRCRRALQVGALFVVYCVAIVSFNGLLGFLTVPFGTTLQSAAVALLIATLVVSREGTLYQILNVRMITAVGIMSYSLYLWQQIFLYPGAYPDGDLWWRAFPINVLMTFVVALISYRLIELPVHKLKRRRAVVR